MHPTDEELGPLPHDDTDAEETPAVIGTRIELVKGRIAAIDAQLAAPGMEAAGRGLTRTEAAAWVLRARAAREFLVSELVHLRGRRDDVAGQEFRAREALVRQTRLLASLNQRIAALEVRNATLEAENAALRDTSDRRVEVVVTGYTNPWHREVPEAELATLRELAEATPTTVAECDAFLKSLPDGASISPAGRRALGAIQVKVGAIRKALRAARAAPTTG